MPTSFSGIYLPSISGSIIIHDLPDDDPCPYTEGAAPHGSVFFLRKICIRKVFQEVFIRLHDLSVGILQFSDRLSKKAMTFGLEALILLDFPPFLGAFFESEFLLVGNPQEVKDEPSINTVQLYHCLTP